VDITLAHPEQRQQLGAQADILEQPHDLVVDVHRARLGVGQQLAFGHEDAEIGVAQKVGRHRAERATADGEHIVLCGLLRHPAAPRVFEAAIKAECRAGEQPRPG
jgi:hypothetical protein